MKDMASNVKLELLQGPAAISADAYSKYIDTQGADGVGFEVICYPSTADESNFVTPVLYGTNSETPGTFTEYTACEAAEMENGLFTAVKATTAGNVQFRSLVTQKYRYYCIFLDETSTAAGVYGVVAHVAMASQPSDGVTLTTGAVT